MRNLSTGHPSTLGSYRLLAAKILGDSSPAVRFIDHKISESPHGEDEEVIQEEGQMIMLLMEVHSSGTDDDVGDHIEYSSEKFTSRGG